MIQSKKGSKTETGNVRIASALGQNSKNLAHEVRNVIAGGRKIDVGNALLNKILNKYDVNNGIKSKLSKDKGTNGDRAFELENEGNFDARLHKNVSQFDPKFREMIRQVARDTVRRKILELSDSQDDYAETCHPSFAKLLNSIHATELQDVKINNFVNSVQNVKEKLNDLKELRGTYDSLMEKLSAETFIDNDDDDGDADFY